MSELVGAQECGSCKGEGRGPGGVICAFCGGAGVRANELETNPVFAEMRAVMAALLLNKHVLRLNLFQRVARWFLMKNWMADDLYVVAVVAVACVKIGAAGQKFKIPEDARGVNAAWSRLHFMVHATAKDIVDTLELHHFLEAA